MGQTRPLFLLISVLFSTQWQILHKFEYKKRRWCVWDLNPGWQDGRRRRILWALAAPLLSLLLSFYLYLFFKKMGRLRPLFLFIYVFSNKHLIFYNKYMWKMSIQYIGLGFEPTTFWTWVSSHNHYTRALSLSFIYFVSLFLPFIHSLSLSLCLFFLYYFLHLNSPHFPQCRFSGFHSHIYVVHL